MLRKLRPLTWKEFDKAVINIANYFHHTPKAIYGHPRGGLCLAVALSHKMKLPLLDYPEKHSLWVDDVVETGVTLRKFLNDDLYYATWFGPKEMTSLYSVEIISKDEWLVFPWENYKDAKEDMVNYVISRE